MKGGHKKPAGKIIPPLSVPTGRRLAITYQQPVRYPIYVHQILELVEGRVLVVSLVLRLSWNANLYRTESLVSFVRKHDVIKIGQKQKGNVCALFNQLRFNARCVCYSMPDS